MIVASLGGTWYGVFVKNGLLHSIVLSSSACLPGTGTVLQYSVDMFRDCNAVEESQHVTPIYYLLRSTPYLVSIEFGTEKESGILEVIS